MISLMETTGECWAISAHQMVLIQLSMVHTGDMTLDQLWSQHRELFDNDSRDSFPLC